VKGSLGLGTWGLVCPGACKWAHSDPEAATGQAKCLSPDDGGISIVYIVYIFSTNELSS